MRRSRKVPAVELHPPCWHAHTAHHTSDGSTSSMPSYAICGTVEAKPLNVQSHRDGNRTNRPDSDIRSDPSAGKRPWKHHTTHDRPDDRFLQLNTPDLCASRKAPHGTRNPKRYIHTEKKLWRVRRRAARWQCIAELATAGTARWFSGLK